MENMVSREKLTSYYKNKKVFVTGHTGFKGTWLCACLHLSGATVKGYSLAPVYENVVLDYLDSNKIINSCIADIREGERLKKELVEFQPDYIFHLAAQPLVRRSYKKPVETFEVNVLGTANLLEAMQKLDGKCTTIIITTDKVYENKEKNILYKEDDVLGGYDPYSASKACTEIVVSSFRNSFFNLEKYNDHLKAVASVRAGNVIGGGDWNEDRIVPDIIRALQNSRTVQVRNPNAVRPWQHVLDPIAAYLYLGGLLNEEPQCYSKPYNIGPLPDDHLTVKNLVELAIQCWDEGRWEDISDSLQPHEAGLLQLSIERAEKELKWKPKLLSAAAIKWTIDWYRQTKDKQVGFTFEQIENYFAL